MKAMVLMTRIPHPGGTKTRLMSVMSGEDCAKLHTSFLRDYFNCLDKVKSQADIFVTYGPENFNENFFKMIPGHFKSYMQEGETLGERMFNAFEYLFGKGYTSVILVGSDVPNIQPSIFREAINSLKENDIVMSPTQDGGYCLIGLNENHKELFVNDLKWGNQSVMDGTLDIAKALGLTVDLLKKQGDIDLPEDLNVFMAWARDNGSNVENLPHNTIECLKEIFENNDYDYENDSETD